jgi:hypothetical protein
MPSGSRLARIPSGGRTGGALAGPCRPARPIDVVLGHLAPAGTGEQFVDREADVAGDLPQQRRGDVAPGMEGNGRHTAVRVAELLVRAPLPDFGEAMSLEQRDDLPRLQDWRFRHGQATRTV